MDAIFLSALNISITATYLILAVLLLRLLLKKAPRWISCLLWGIVALRLVMPFSIESEISLIPSSQTITATQSQNLQYEINTGIDAFDNTINQIIVQDIPTDSPTLPIVTETPETDMFTNTEQEQNNKLSLFDVLFIVWVVGIVAMFIFSAVSYIRIYKNVHPSVSYCDNIYYCDNIDSPFILGIIKPKIYIPSRIDESSLNYVIEHEHAHLKRYDHLWKPFGFLLLSIYWFNPFLWLSYILLCRDIESACDEKVIKDMSREDKKGYSTALFNCSVHRSMITACPVAFGEVGVKERIKSVLNYKKPTFWIVAVAIVTSIAVAVCFLTNPKKEEILDLPFLPLELSVSGNGAWHYTLTFNPNGSFEGKYTDWNAESGEDYAGMYYICEFSGKFKNIKVNDDYSYSLTLAKFESKYKDGEEWIEDGTKYIAIDTLEDMNIGDKFLLYKPTMPINEIDGKILIDWPYRHDENNGVLSCYALCNPKYYSGYFSETIFTVNDSTVINAYYQFMNNFYEENQDFYYAIKEIDGNDIKELIIKNNTAITVYTYEEDIKQLGSYDFVTGTVRLFASEKEKHPGIFYFTVGGSCEHYSYLTIKNGAIVTEKLAEDHYAAEELGYDKRTWVDISEDKEKIEEAKQLYKSNSDIKFVKFMPLGSDSKNSVTFTNHSITYTATVIFDEQNNAKSFVVINKDTGEIVQETEIERYENFADKPIYAMDVTFDGYLDLLIPYERPASAVYFSAYIYDASHSDTKENDFVYAPSFEEIPNFALDLENEEILSKRTQSQRTSYDMYWYSFTDSDFRLLNSLYYEPAHLKDASYLENEIYFVETSYDFDEKETIVNEFVAASGDDFMNPDKSDPKIAPYYEVGSVWDLDSDKWNSVVTANSVLEGFTLVPAQNPLTLGEVKAIFEPLLKKAVSVEQTIMNDTGSLKYEKEFAFTQNQSNYSLITDESFQTLGDVWNYTYTTFTIEASQRTFRIRLDQNSESPRFLEKDGKLYYNRNGHGYKSDFDIDSLKIINQFEDAVIVSIDKYGFGTDENSPDKCIFIMQNTTNGWRLANTETESYDIDVSDYTQDAIAQSNKVNTVLNTFVDFLNGKSYAKDESPNKPSLSKDYLLITDLCNRNLQSGVDQYTFFDLNYDNIPEMVTEGYCMTVFAYKDGQLTMIYESPAGSSSQKALLQNKKIYWSLTTTGTSYEFATFDKNLNVTIDTYFDGKTVQEGDKEIYYHNAQEITEDAFNDYKAEFFSAHFLSDANTVWYAYNTSNNTVAINVGM